MKDSNIAQTVAKRVATLSSCLGDLLVFCKGVTIVVTHRPLSGPISSSLRTMKDSNSAKTVAKRGTIFVTFLSVWLLFEGGTIVVPLLQLSNPVSSSSRTIKIRIVHKSLRRE